MEVNHFGIWFFADQIIADRMHQVGFTQPYSPVDKQWVIGKAGILSNLHGRSASKLIRLTHNETVERVIRLQRAPVHQLTVYYRIYSGHDFSPQPGRHYGLLAAAACVFSRRARHLGGRLLWGRGDGTMRVADLQMHSERLARLFFQKI